MAILTGQKQKRYPLFKFKVSNEQQAMEDNWKAVKIAYDHLFKIEFAWLILKFIILYNVILLYLSFVVLRLYAATLRKRLKRVLNKTARKPTIALITWKVTTPEETRVTTQNKLQLIPIYMRSQVMD